jgi:hypothetical protein
MYQLSCYVSFKYTVRGIRNTSTLVGNMALWDVKPCIVPEDCIVFNHCCENLRSHHVMLPYLINNIGKWKVCYFLKSHQEQEVHTSL